VKLALSKTSSSGLAGGCMLKSMAVELAAAIALQSSPTQESATEQPKKRLTSVVPAFMLEDSD
jgi:hypothetical protein